MTTNGVNDVLRHLRMLFSKEDGETLHQATTQFFPAIIYLYDAGENKLKFLNEHKISELLGYTTDEIRELGHDVTKMVFKDDMEQVKKEMEKFNVLQDDEDHSYYSRLNHKEGDWRYYCTRGIIARRNEEGAPSSLIFMAEDVTEKIKAEEEVAALKKLFDDTQDLLDFGSWSIDTSIDKLYWTDGMYNLLDYKKADVGSDISMDFYMKHLSDNDAHELKRLIDNAITNKTEFEYRYTVKTNSGKEKIVSTKGRPVVNSNGNVIQLLGITRDITRQTKINRDLVHYREMIMEKEEFLNQGTWETDVKTGETTWSKGMYNLFGYTPEQRERIAVTNELHFSHMSEENVIKSKESWKDILEHKDNYIREATIISADGKVKRLETYGKVLRDNLGNAEKVIGTTRDVTRLHEYERSLEEKIKELHRSNTELEEFAYVASHDLQEPLRKLSTFSERLQAKFSDKLGKDGIVYLDRIIAATENMRVLIENLLEFSRTARSGRHFVSMDMTKIIDEVKADLELKIEESGTEIRSTQLPIIEIIPPQIKQLFTNLLSNSIKFKKKGEHSIIDITAVALSTAEAKAYNLKVEKPYYKILVEDNGIGFEKEYSERIFQIFQRLHGKAEYPGSGIGLAICKKIVENHNGIISATGDLGKGAVFTVVLPQTQTQS